MKSRSQQRPTKKPWYKYWWSWVLIVIILLFLIGVFGGNDDANNKKPYTITSSQKTKLQKKFTNYTDKWDSIFEKAEVRKNKIVITFDDDDVEAPVADAGLEAVLENSYSKANKIQKQCNTRLPYEFKDKSSGTFAKSSHSGKGWFKELSNGEFNDKMKFNFKTGDAEEE